MMGGGGGSSRLRPAALVWLAVCGAAAVVQGRGGGNGSYTSQYGDFLLGWAVAADNLTMTLTMTAATTGWIAVGFNSNSRMDGADYYVGWIEAASGLPVVFDSYASGNNQPTPDTQLPGGTSTVDQVQGYAVGRQA